MEIPWGLVAEYLEAQCSGVEIASALGCSTVTLYACTKRDHGMDWSVYARRHYSRGCQILRKAQFDKALSGHYGMLIWLGKQYLNQYDRQAIAVKTDADIDVSKLSDAELASLQSGALTIENVLQKYQSNANANKDAQELEMVSYDDLVYQDCAGAGEAVEATSG